MTARDEVVEHQKFVHGLWVQHLNREHHALVRNLNPLPLRGLLRDVARHHLDVPRALVGVAQVIAEGEQAVAHDELIHRRLSARLIVVIRKAQVPDGVVKLIKIVICTRDFDAKQVGGHLNIKHVSLQGQVGKGLAFQANRNGLWMDPASVDGVGSFVNSLNKLQVRAS